MTKHRNRPFKLYVWWSNWGSTRSYASLKAAMDAWRELSPSQLDNADVWEQLGQTKKYYVKNGKHLGNNPEIELDS